MYYDKWTYLTLRENGETAKDALAIARIPPIGSVSWGTLCDDDLIGAFRDILSELDPRHDLLMVSDSDYACPREYVSDLIDALNEFAPPLCYFGSTEGDGTDFGFWVSPYLDPYDLAEYPRFEDLESGYSGFWIDVTDHGNISLYYQSIGGASVEIWGVC